MKEALLLVLFLIALTSLCDTISQLFLKSTIDALEFTPKLNFKKIFKFMIKLIAKPRLWLGLVFSLVSLCIWLVVLSKVDLNFAFSADSMHYIFIALASRFVLKEKMGSNRWWGTGLIVAGIVFVSLS
ncbi:MAG TPA: EamA family transporter [Candidatus Omnitrophota bacterium]|nr:EamA family transporter [Candidatus Omnitrophota bacterium]HPT38759.1 EamA family transporter [Candidatus Omnitrophota bacterium]